MPHQNAGDRKGSNGKRQETPSKAVWVGYADISLTPQDKARFKAEYVPTVDLLGAIAASVEQGYKVSLSHDEKHGTCQASLTAQAADSPNAGYTMSGRAGDVLTALAVVMFKHWDIARGGSWGAVTQEVGGNDIS